MSLDVDYLELRDTINECIGYRVLEAKDVLQEGDETACGSLILGGWYGVWVVMDSEEWADYFGQTVEWANDDERGDMDASERLFRRKI
jgi:hypothetical protein